MILKALGIAFNFASMSFALAAAYQWRRSATDKATLDQAKTDGPEILIGMKTPLIATLEIQGTWSRRAASNAGLSALFQALALICQTLPG